MKMTLCETEPCLYFFRYKGVPSPWEMMEKNRFYGPKCFKYSKWHGVHANENSRKILLEAGNHLIDNAGIITKSYAELALVWKAVAAWARSPDHSDTEPIEIEEFEIFRRLLDVAETNPGIVNSIIKESKLEISGYTSKKKWTLFLAINYFKYLTSNKKLSKLLTKYLKPEQRIKKGDEFVKNIIEALKAISSAATEKYQSKAAKNFLELFTKDLGIEISPPEINDLETFEEENIRVVVEKYNGNEIDLVKFTFVSGKVIVKLNQRHKIFSLTDAHLTSMTSDKYWILIGETIYSKLDQIDEIQSFFDGLSKKIHMAY